MYTVIVETAKGAGGFFQKITGDRGDRGSGLDPDHELPGEFRVNLFESLTDVRS